MKLYIDRSPETRLCKFVSAVILCVFLTNISYGISGAMGFHPSLISGFLKMVMALLFLFRAGIILKRMDQRLLLFLGTAICVVTADYIAFPALEAYFTDTLITFFSFCLTTYIVCYQIRDHKKLKIEITRASYLIAAMAGLLLAGIFSGRLPSFNNGGYSMGFGYSCVVPAIFLSAEAVQHRRKAAAVGAAVLTIAIVAFGSRGPLIELFLFTAFLAVRDAFEKRKYVRGGLITAGIGALLLAYKDLLMLLGEFLQRYGLQSRTIQTLTAETVHLSGRDRLFERLLPAIMEAPFAVRGINAEWAVIGIYAHNIAVELLYQLGCVAGGAVILFILGRIIRTLTLTELDDQKLRCMIFMFASIPQLMVSGSLWTNYVFWMWSAFMSRLIQDQRRDRRRRAGGYGR